MIRALLILLITAFIAVVVFWQDGPPRTLPGAPDTPSESRKAAPPASPSSGDVTVVTQAAPTRPREQMDEARFRELCRESLGALPTRADAKKLDPKDAHHGFGIIVQAGETLGRIAQLIHDNPELAEEGRRFYQRCAENGLVMTYVRALCYADWKNLGGKRKSDSAANVPAGVKQLAEQVPSS
jgi:hypothetical protein